MALKGLHMPNAMWREWSEEEMGAVEDLKPDILLVLVYGTSAAFWHARQLRELKTWLPDIKFIYRFYPTPKPATLSGADWAGWCKERLNLCGFPVGEIVPANEMNIEGWGSDWPAMHVWLREFAQEYMRLDPFPRLHLPALSPAPG